MNMRAWLQLIRLPNAFSVPGDPLAGALMASNVMAEADTPVPWGQTLLVCAAAVLLYFGGLILNDLVDLAEDTRERPTRPLPSRRISMSAAILVAGICFAGGLALCSLASQYALAIGGVLFGCILLYNLVAKSVLVFGPLTMGLCRGCSFLLGVSVMRNELSFSNPVLGAFHMLTIYIALVTMLARHETTSFNPGLTRLFPAATLVIGMIGLLVALPEREFGLPLVTFALFASLAIYLALDAARCIKVLKRVTPPAIGQMVGNLILIQAALIALAGRPLLALLVLSFWPINRWIRGRIYAS